MTSLRSGKGTTVKKAIKVITLDVQDWEKCVERIRTLDVVPDVVRILPDRTKVS